MTELADLLTGPTARHALACRDIAAVFRILRDAGISQTRIALATKQRESEVSEILAGRRVQSVAVLTRIADGLGVPRGWMGLAYAADVAPTHQHTQTEDTSDDNLLRHAAIVLCGSPVFGAANPIRVQHAPTPIPSRIGLADIQWVTATTDRLDQLVGDLGGIPMTAVLTAHTRASERLLGAHHAWADPAAVADRAGRRASRRRSRGLWCRVARPCPSALQPRHGLRRSRRGPAKGGPVPGHLGQYGAALRTE